MRKKLMKKLQLFLAGACALACFNMPKMSAKASESIEDAQTIEMGTYLGEQDMGDGWTVRTYDTTDLTLGGISPMFITQTRTATDYIYCKEEYVCTLVRTFKFNYDNSDGIVTIRSSSAVISDDNTACQYKAGSITRAHKNGNPARITVMIPMVYRSNGEHVSDLTFLAYFYNDGTVYIY